MILTISDFRDIWWEYWCGICLNTSLCRNLNSLRYEVTTLLTRTAHRFCNLAHVFSSGSNFASWMSHTAFWRCLISSASWRVFLNQSYHPQSWKNNGLSVKSFLALNDWYTDSALSQFSYPAKQRLFCPLSFNPCDTQLEKEALLKLIAYVFFYIYTEKYLNSTIGWLIIFVT